MQRNTTQPKKKKIKFATFVTRWMDLENIMLSKIGQTEMYKNHIISVSVEQKTKKQQANKENKVIHTDNRMVVTRGKGSREGKERKRGQIYVDHRRLDFR